MLIVWRNSNIVYKWPPFVRVDSGAMQLQSETRRARSDATLALGPRLIRENCAVNCWPTVKVI